MENSGNDTTEGVARIDRVDSVTAVVVGTDPPHLAISAQGTAPSTGYTNPFLFRTIPIDDTPPADGVYSYVFFVTPPTGMVIHGPTRVSASATWEPIPAGITAIRVYAQTNMVQAAVQQPANAAGA